MVVEISGTVELRTDTTLSDGSSSESTDSVLVRDPFTGLPVWRGTGQAGVMRHHLAAIRPELVPATFGQADRSSRVHTADALARLPAAHLVGRRSGNRIDPHTRQVERGAVFTTEVLPAGTCFPVAWHLHLPREGDGAVPASLVGMVLAASGLVDEPDGIRLGLRSGRGRGAVAGRGWRVRLHDLGTPEGFDTWFGGADPVPDGPGSPTLLDALATALDAVAGPCSGRQLRAAVHAVEHEREQLLLQLIVAVGEPDPVAGVRPTTLLHGVTPFRRDSDDPDLVPLARPGRSGTVEPLDSGSAVHNLLVRQARWALRTLAAPEIAEDMLRDLFGGGAEGTVAPRPSRVRETEAPVVGSSAVTWTRNNIDPLTQGTVPGLLFTEVSRYGGDTTWQVQVRGPKAADVGLLALVLRDLADGAAQAVGHGSASGHGRRLLTSATVSIRGAALCAELGLDAAPEPMDWPTFRDGPLPRTALAALRTALSSASEENR
jgi:hypothetical protein